MEKLRPEQRKLWRKTYHQERDRGETPKVASERADDAVSTWEARGAFSDDVVTVPPFMMSNGRVCSWIQISTAADGATLFIGDAVVDESGREWHVADTMHYYDAAIVRVSHDVTVSEHMPAHGSKMTFRAPRLGCAPIATYLGGRSPTLSQT